MQSLTSSHLAAQARSLSADIQSKRLIRLVLDELAVDATLVGKSSTDKENESSPTKTVVRKSIKRAKQRVLRPSPLKACESCLVPSLRGSPAINVSASRAIVGWIK